MKNSVVVLILMGAFAFTGFGQTNAVDWGQNNINNFYVVSGGSTYADRLPEGYLVQLIWSLDNQLSAIDTANPFLPTGDDVLMFTSTIGSGNIAVPLGATDNGGTFYYGQYNFPENTATNYGSGYAYMRVFQTNSTTINIGQTLYYLEGPASAGTLSIQPTDIGVSPPPTVVNLNLMAGGPTYIPLSSSLEMVPEPASFALFAVGAGLLAMRRKFGKQQQA